MNKNAIIICGIISAIVALLGAFVTGAMFVCMDFAGIYWSWGVWEVLGFAVGAASVIIGIYGCLRTVDDYVFFVKYEDVIETSVAGDA